MKNKILSTFLALVMLVGLVIPMTASVGAVQYADGNTVNIAAARQNVHGNGYEWDNRKSILTLDGCNIVTNDDYGLRLPDGCTVVVNGNNYISAAKYGISCAGNVIFKGKGTLTVDAGTYGIYLISQDNTTKVRILSGKYKVMADKCGVYSDYTDFSLAGGSFDVSVKDGGRAVLGRTVNLVGGSFSSNGTVEAMNTLLCDSVDIDIKSSESALVGKKLTVRNIALDGMEEYNGETSVAGKATTRRHTKSILFPSMPGWVDWVLLAVVVLLAAACIVLPVLHRRKKKKELYARLKEEGWTE